MLVFCSIKAKHLRKNSNSRDAAVSVIHGKLPCYTRSYTRTISVQIAPLNYLPLGLTEWLEFKIKCVELQWTDTDTLYSCVEETKPLPLHSICSFRSTYKKGNRITKAGRKEGANMLINTSAF